MVLLESHYQDMQDIEFTVEDEKLYLLQTRNGKRTASAALKVARDLVSEGVIDQREALRRIEPAQLNQLLHPDIDPEHGKTPLTKGLNASPGAAVGTVVFDAVTAWTSPVQYGRKTLVQLAVGGSLPSLEPASHGMLPVMALMTGEAIWLTHPCAGMDHR